MIKQTLRESILVLWRRGMSKRQIAIALTTNRSTVRRVVAASETMRLAA